MERRPKIGRWLPPAALAAAAAIACAAPGPSQAQRVVRAPPCGQLCDAGARQAAERALGLTPIQNQRREGLVAYRMLAVSGLGRPLPSMTFFRQGSGVAFVEVRALLPSEGRLQLGVARWPVDPAIWERLRAQIDALPGQEAAGDPRACAGDWSYSLQTVRDRDAASYQAACPDAVQDLADAMAQGALDANPACPGKAPRDGGPYGRLEHCLAAVASPSPGPPRP